MNLLRVPAAATVLSLVIPALALPSRSRVQSAQQGTAAQAAQPGRVPLTPDPGFAQFVYDVVSIKPFQHDPAALQEWYGARETPDGFLAHCPVDLLIYQAFRYEQAGVDKASGWVVNDNYEVEAKMDPAVAPAFAKLGTIDQTLAREHMLQVMLRDRFKFTFHTEPHEVNGLDLVVGKNGPKLKEAAVQAGDNGPALAGMQVQGSNGVTEWDGRATGIGSMLGQLFYETGKTVFDKTGLTGRYDFTLKFGSVHAGAGNAMPLDAAPALTTALEEQLGLKLVPTKVTKDFIVIDHIERPSGN